MKLVSIVVPVYNTEVYIEKCLDSILNQTYQNIELIIINDGSSDNSQAKIQKYSSNKKVKIYSQDNHGAAYTRNFGLQVATGDYITFIDSDDYIDSDYLETYVTSFKTNTDIVLGGYKKQKSHQTKPFLPKNCEWDIYRYSATCGKMYSRSFLIKHSIKYGNTELLEDVIFNLNCLFNKANYQIIPYAGYYYVYNSNSLSNNRGKNPQQMINIFSTIKHIDNVAKQNNYHDEKKLINYYLNTYLFMIFMCCRKSSYQFLKEQTNNFMSWLTNNYPNWQKSINKFKENDSLNKLIIIIWKGFYNIKLSNLLLYMYSKI